MNKFILGFGAAIAAMAVQPASAATLTGYNIETTYYYGDFGDTYAGATFTPANFIVGAGPETVLNIEDKTWVQFDFGASTLNFSHQQSLTASWGPGTFNGPVFTGAAIGRITGVSILSSNLPGFDLSRVSVVGNELRINWANLAYSPKTDVTLGFAMVPEPATWAMMISGFGLVGFAARRRRAALAA